MIDSLTLFDLRDVQYYQYMLHLLIFVMLFSFLKISIKFNL